MAQPRDPPLSIRLGEARSSNVDDYAAKRGINRHAAILALVDAGLQDADLAWSNQDVAAMKARGTPKPLEINRIPPTSTFRPHPKPGKR